MTRTICRECTYELRWCDDCLCWHHMTPEGNHVPANPQTVHTRPKGGT